MCYHFNVATHKVTPFDEHKKYICTKFAINISVSRKEKLNVVNTLTLSTTSV